MTARTSIQRILTTLFAAPKPTPQRVAPAEAEPGSGRTLGRRRLVPAYLLAVALPIAVGVALIPLRDEIDHSISLLMLLPVLVVAVLGGAATGVIGAVSAGLMFDVLHTEPYYRLVIDDSDDITEMVVLLVVGVAAGLISEYAHRSVIASETRRRELEVLTGFVRASTGPLPDDAVIEDGRRSIEELLSLRTCEWWPGYHGTVGPVLQPDGTLSRAVGTLRGGSGSVEMATLPSVVELPIGPLGGELGRYMLYSTPDRHVSIEERRAAAAIAKLIEFRLRSAASRGEQPSAGPPAARDDR